MPRFRVVLSRLGLRVILTAIGSLILVGNFLVGPAELAVFDRDVPSDAEKSEGAECWLSMAALSLEPFTPASS